MNNPSVLLKGFMPVFWSPARGVRGLTSQQTTFATGEV